MTNQRIGDLLRELRENGQALPPMAGGAVPTYTPMIDTAGASGGALAFAASTSPSQDLAKDRMYTEFDVVDTIVLNNGGVSVANDDPLAKCSGGLKILGTGNKPFIGIDDMRLAYYDNLFDYQGANVADLNYVTGQVNTTYHQGYRLHLGESPKYDPINDPWGLHSGELDLSCAIDGEAYNVFQHQAIWPANNVAGTNATMQTTSGRVMGQKGVQGLHNRTHVNPDGSQGPLWRTASPFWWTEQWTPGAVFNNLSYPIPVTPGAFIREVLFLFDDNGVAPANNRTDTFFTEIALQLPYGGKVTPLYLPIHLAKFRSAMDAANDVSNGNNGATPGSAVVGKAMGVFKLDLRKFTGDRRGLNVYKKVDGSSFQKGELSWQLTVATGTGKVWILYKGWYPPEVVQPGNTIWNQPLAG